LKDTSVRQPAAKHGQDLAAGVRVGAGGVYLQTVKAISRSYQS
jgi:hypothetical protein